MADDCPCIHCGLVREARRAKAVYHAAQAIAREAGDLTRVESRAVIISTELIRALQGALGEEL